MSNRFSPDLHGWLDSPQEAICGEPLQVVGWVFSRTRAIEDVFMRGQSGRTWSLRMGERRLDVAAEYPDSPRALLSGFAGRLPQLVSREAGSLWIVVRLEDGSEEEAFEIHVRDGSSSPSADVQGSRQNAGLALREGITEIHQASLQSFLDGGGRLRFATFEYPQVSIVIPVFGRAELVLRSLRSVAASTCVATEVVLVDNASQDETTKLLERINGVTVIQNRENLGFSRAVNQGVDAARGDLILLLNSDAELAPGALRSMTAALWKDPRVGAVGGKLVHPDGRLQEAGSILWRDGSCQGYGRGANPAAPQFNFRRDVDFCSAAMLMTPRKLFLGLGGFDERFSPAYYEDVDYCVRLHRNGLRVLYEPNALAFHLEFASSGNRAEALALQIANRKRLIEKHADWITGQYRPGPGAELFARHRPLRGLRILFIDDRVPDPADGSGFPRAFEIVRTLAELGHHVSIFATDQAPLQETGVALPAEVEVCSQNSMTMLSNHLRERASFYDRVLVSRPHNMERLAPWLARLGAPIIYDAEAVFAFRDAGFARTVGQPWTEERIRRAVKEEISLAKSAAAVLTVSQRESKLFLAADRKRPVRVLSHAVSESPFSTTFGERRGFLFVGAIGPQSPNLDSVCWFVESVLPLLAERIPAEALLTIVGRNSIELLEGLSSSRVNVLGRVENLDSIASCAKVFVAPTRFSAGIPLKLLHAAAWGLPTVATPELACQLGWTPGVELLTGSSAEEFANACVCLSTDAAVWSATRKRALQRVRKDHTRRRFAEVLGEVLAAAVPVGRESASRTTH